MYIEHFIQNIKKSAEQNSSIFQISDPVQEESIIELENRLVKQIPDQIKSFYRICNGLIVQKPVLEIKPIEKLQIDDKGMLVFAVFNEAHFICFDTNSINAAAQWDILNYETGYLVTMTMASFWSNKVFAWLNKQRTIWKEEIY